MKNLNHRTFEKLIAIAVTLSFMTSLSAPVFAQGVSTESALDTTVSSTSANFPVIEERPVKAVRYVTATAYSSDVWQNDITPFLPANGVDYREVFAKEGDVRCVALNDLPLGTIIRIKDERVTSIYGTEPVKVCDRKNARYNGMWSMDMYTISVDENGKIDSKTSLDAARKVAKQFGVKRKVKIEILEFGTTLAKAKAKAAAVAKEQAKMELAFVSSDMNVKSSTLASVEVK